MGIFYGVNNLFMSNTYLIPFIVYLLFWVLTLSSFGSCKDYSIDKDWVWFLWRSGLRLS